MSYLRKQHEEAQQLRCVANCVAIDRKEGEGVREIEARGNDHEQRRVAIPSLRTTRALEFALPPFFLTLDRKTVVFPLAREAYF